MTGMLKALGSRAIIGAFNKRLEEVSQSSWLPTLALSIASNQEIETYDFLSDTPAMAEWVGNRTKQGLKVLEFSVRNKKFSGGLEIDEDDFRRDKTGQIMVKVNGLAARAAQLPQKIISGLINTNGNAYDGVAFYHASSHKNLNNDTIDNAIQVAAATGTVPTAAEMETAILTAIEKILGWKDDSGEPRNEFAQEFTVMVPTTLWKQASAALKNDYVAAGQSNSIKAMGFTINLVMNPRLTSQVYMYVHRSDSDVKAFVWQDEVPTMMQPLTEGSDFHILHDKRAYFVKRVCNGGYGRFDQSCRVEFT